MFPEGIEKFIAAFLNFGGCLVAALPLRCAVRLRLTEPRPLKMEGGYASLSLIKASRRHLANISFLIAMLICISASTFAQKKRIPPGARIAIVADERLAALRNAPDLSARLIRRLSRGRLVSVRDTRRSREGVLFYRVVVTRRTAGWVQSEAVISAWRSGDDERLRYLIVGSDEFDRIARARIFVDTFPHSRLLPTVLLILGDAAEEAAARLSREAQRRFERREIPADGAPEFTYFMNYSGLDRYNRQGVTFTFDQSAKQFHYDGAAWRQILRRYRNSPEAIEARKRLENWSTQK